MTQPPHTSKPLAKKHIVKCPQCRQDTEYSTENPWRPFCSERCHQIDMGAWASETYRIESTPPSTDDPHAP